MDYSLSNWIIILALFGIFAGWWITPSFVAIIKKLQRKLHTANVSDSSESTLSDKPRYSKPPTADQIVAIHVEARSGEHFAGIEVIDFLKTNKLEAGESGMYQLLQSGKVVFSVVNGVEPGYLDKDFEHEQSYTPCITFFFIIAVGSELQESLATMLGVAKKMADQFNAVIQDDDRSVINEQTRRNMLATMQKISIKLKQQQQQRA